MTLVNQELNYAKEQKGGDNYWLVALEKAVGDLPCEEPSAFSDLKPLTDDQKEYLDSYHQLYDQLTETYQAVLQSFGFKPRF